MKSTKQTPKTGLTSRMREWMQRQRRPFTVAQLCEGLMIPPGRERDKVRNAISDFVQRVEIFPVAAPRRKAAAPQKTAYARNPAWHRVHRGTLNRRIYKAMYVSGRFALSDIQRLSEAPDRNWIDKVARSLKTAGMIRAVGRRICAHGIGAEIIYHIPDRDRFRLEVMR